MIAGVLVVVSYTVSIMTCYTIERVTYVFSSLRWCEGEGLGDGGLPLLRGWHVMMTCS
jgi:hypothetical protein